MQQPVLTAAEGKTWHGHVFQAMFAPTTLLIMFMTQRRMVLDSRTINRAFQCVMAQETKCAISISNEMHLNKQMAQPLSYSIQEAEHACQCNAT